MKKRRNNHGRPKKSEVPLEQREYRKKRKHRKAKTEKTKTEKTDKKPGKKNRKKTQIQQNSKEKRNLKIFDEKNGATYPKAKTKLR